MTDRQNDIKGSTWSGFTHLRFRMSTYGTGVHVTSPFKRRKKTTICQAHLGSAVTVLLIYGFSINPSHSSTYSLSNTNSFSFFGRVQSVRLQRTCCFLTGLQFCVQGGCIHLRFYLPQHPLLTRMTFCGTCKRWNLYISPIDIYYVEYDGDLFLITLLTVVRDLVLKLVNEALITLKNKTLLHFPQGCNYWRSEGWIHQHKK